jgi:hypothetical protein
VSLNELLGVALLLAHLLSWISLRERMAGLTAEFRGFKEDAKRRLGALEGRGHLHLVD